MDLSHPSKKARISHSASVNRKKTDSLFSWIPFTFSPKPEWKEEEVIVDSLDKRNMFFFNRAHAVKQLQTIHRSKYYRAASNGEGEDWIIPLADNVIGLGKTALGRHYIPNCRESWPTGRNEFQRTLCDCHTVPITFGKGDLLLRKNFDAVMLERLAAVLSPMFKVAPEVLSCPPKTAHEFLKCLTLQVGPVFIVLDEIGDAFEADDLDDTQRIEKFMSFCKNILSKWFMLKHVFFLVLGRGSFLSGTFPWNLMSRFKIERLNLLES